MRGRKKEKEGQELVIIFNCCQDKLNTISSKLSLVVSLDFCNTLGVKLSTKNIIFTTLKNYRTLVMFGYGKKHQQIKKTSSEMTLLYYKVGKEGVITNYQAWLRGWREHKITEFDVIFQEGLRELK